MRIGSAATATRSGANAGNTSPARARGRSSSPPANPSAGTGRTPAGPSGRRGQGFTGTYSPMDRVALHRFTYDQQRIAAQQTQQTRQRVRELNEFMASMRVNESSREPGQESTGTHHSTDHNALGILTPTDDRQRIATQQRVRELNEFMASMRAHESSREPGQESTGTHHSTDHNALGIPTPTDDRQRIATQQRVRELNEFMASM
ncbi:alpha/beta hydrolase, partial [Ralstonia solanacearum]